MNLSNIVNSAGLVCDLIGVVLLFIYGLPPSLESNKNKGVTATDAKAPREIGARNKKDDRYKKISYLALALLVVGFMLQLTSNFLHIQRIKV
jgi:hypothetical protein